VPAKNVVVEVVSVVPNIVVRPVPTADAANWAADSLHRRPGDLRLTVSATSLAQLLAIAGSKAWRLP